MIVPLAGRRLNNQPSQTPPSEARRSPNEMPVRCFASWLPAIAHSPWIGTKLIPTNIPTCSYQFRKWTSNGAITRETVAEAAITPSTLPANTMLDGTRTVLAQATATCSEALLKQGQFEEWRSTTP